MTLFEKMFTEHLICEFKDFQRSTGPRPESPWHRKEARGPAAMNQHQVADRYKGRYVGPGDFKYSGELNSKIESVRDGSNSLRVLSAADLKHIKDSYPTDLSKDKPRGLGNSGMIVFWDKLKGEWFIKKQ